VDGKEPRWPSQAFRTFDLADADREWDGDAADKRVRKWADAEDEPNQKYRDAHVWYEADNKDNLTAYKLLICDVANDKRVIPAGRLAAPGSRPVPRSSAWSPGLASTSARPV
jgi:hypothetical protein